MIVNDELLKLKALALRAQLSPDAPLPDGATRAQVEEYESQLGILIPQELKEWLMVVGNGPCIGGGCLLGIDENSKQDISKLGNVLESYPHWKEKNWIPIACDGSGNYYVVVTNGQEYPVAFVDVCEDSWVLTYLVASNIRIFIRQFIEREGGKRGWPFDREYVLSRDPDIGLLDVAPLPWE